MHEEQGNLITTNRISCFIKRAPKSFVVHVEVVKHDHTTHTDKSALKSFFWNYSHLFNLACRLDLKKLKLPQTLK